MKNPYHWLWEFAFRAQSEGDDERFRLVEILELAQSYPSENPDARLALYQQGRDLAQQLNEPAWILVFEYWKCETLLYYKHDPETALRVAAKMMVETRKPQYAAQPERVGMTLNFIAAYSKIDPIGYERQIRDAIEAGKDDWELYEGFYEVYWQLRTRFLTAVGDPEALEVAWQHFHVGCNHQARHDPSGHYTIYALADLIPALWRFDEESARLHTGELAELGELLSPLSENDRLSAVFTMWQAVGAHLKGNEEAAQGFYRRALEKQKSLAKPQNAVFVPGAHFHEVRGDNEKLIALCEEAAELAEKHGLRFEGATWLFKQLEVARRSGFPEEVALKKLQDATTKLPSKEYWARKVQDLPK